MLLYLLYIKQNFKLAVTKKSCNNSCAFSAIPSLAEGMLVLAQALVRVLDALARLQVALPVNDACGRKL